MDENDRSCEPMDIDLSSHSVSAMEISYVEPDTKTSYSPLNTDNLQKKTDDDPVHAKCLNVKPLNINNLIEKHKLNQNRTRAKQFFKYLSYILVLLIAVITYQMAHFRCSENLNIDMLKNRFALKIFGQTGATETLIKALEADVERKVIILYGGTGVGKTYISSIILQNLLNYGNIYHYTMPGFTHTSSDFMFGLIFCKSSLVIVDDLKQSDILNIEGITKELIDKSKTNSKNLTIMLIYNIESIDKMFHKKHDEEFLSKLQQTLQSIDANKYYIKFKSLTQEDLRKCIESEFPGKKFSASEMMNIMKNFNVTIDGCKGVYQKMKYLSIV